jgi:hypothetical protein
VFPLVRGTLSGIPLEPELGHTATYIRCTYLVKGRAQHNSFYIELDNTHDLIGHRHTSAGPDPRWAGEP